MLSSQRKFFGAEAFFVPQKRRVHMSNYTLETKCVQGGYTPGNGEPRQIPLVQSTTFKYATS